MKANTQLFIGIFCILLGGMSISQASAFQPRMSDPAPPQSLPGAPGGDVLFKANVTIQNSDTGTPANYELSSNKSLIQYFDEFKEGNLEQYGWNNRNSALAAQGDIRGADFTFSTHVDGTVRHLKVCFPQAPFSATPAESERLATDGITIDTKGCANFTQELGAAAAKQLYESVTGKKLGVEIPTADIWQQLIDFLTGKFGNGNVMKSLADLWVSKTAIDPVAGNPNSFMAQLTKNNFDLAANGILNGDTSGLNLFSLHPSYISVTNNGYTMKDASLPIQYTHYFNRNNALIIDMPINYQQVQEATTYSLALGLGYTHVVLRTNHNLVWALTPSFHAGVVGSADLGSGTMLYDGALASRVTMPFGGLNWGLTNDISYLQTASVKIGDVETPYDMNNVTMENGVDGTYGLNQNYTIGGYITHFNTLSGIDWFIPSYNELGFKFAKLTKYQTAKYDHMTASLGYLFGPNEYSGVNLTLGFNF